MFKLRLITNHDFSDDAGKDTEFAYGWLPNREGIEDAIQQALEVLEQANTARLSSPAERRRIDTALQFLSQSTEPAEAYCESFRAAYLAMADALHLIKGQCEK